MLSIVAKLHGRSGFNVDNVPGHIACFVHGPQFWNGCQAFEL
jgi:hypothetical protein